MMNDMSKFAGNNPTLKNALDLYKKGEVDEVYMVYTEFVSPLTQRPKLLKVLPLAFDKEENKETKNVIINLNFMKELYKNNNTFFSKSRMCCYF